MCSCFGNPAFGIGLSKMSCIRKPSSLAHGEQLLIDEQLYL